MTYNRKVQLMSMILPITTLMLAGLTIYVLNYGMEPRTISTIVLALSVFYAAVSIAMMIWEPAE